MSALCLVNISQERCQLVIEPRGFIHFSDRWSWFPSVHLMPTSVGFYLIWETNIFCPRQKRILCVFQEMLITLGSLQLSRGQRFFKGCHYTSFLASVFKCKLASASFWSWHCNEKMFLIMGMSKHMKMKYKRGH